jgi:hypothetical protein
LGITFAFEKESFLFFLFTIIWFFSPAPLGCWLGIRWRKTHLLAYLLISSFLGLWDGFIAYFSNPPVVFVDFVFFVLRQLLLFVIGALVGDWIERKRDPKRAGPSLIKQIAIKIAARDRGHKDKVMTMSYEDRLKRWTLIVTLLTSLIAAAVAITTAYIGYKKDIIKNQNVPQRQEGSK